MTTDDANPVTLTDHDREVLWQTLGQCFTCAPNSPESCALVDAMVEQIAASHIRQAKADALRETAAEIYNGAGDPEQAFYNYGLNPWLHARADQYDRTGTNDAD